MIATQYERFADMHKDGEDDKNSYFVRDEIENSILDNALKDLNLRGSVLMVSGFTGMGNTSFLTYAKRIIENKEAPAVFFTFTDDDLINFRKYKFLAETIEDYKIENKLKNKLKDKSELLTNILKSSIDFISFFWPPAILAKGPTEIASSMLGTDEVAVDYYDIRDRFNKALSNIGEKFLKQETFLAIILDDVQWLVDADLTLLKNLLENVPPGIVFILAFRYKNRHSERLDSVFKRYNVLKECMESCRDPLDEKRYQCYELKELDISQISEFAERKGFNKKFIGKIAADIYGKIGGVPDNVVCSLRYIKSMNPEFSDITEELLEETKSKCGNRDKWLYEGLDDRSRKLANQLCILRGFTGITEVISCLAGRNMGHNDLERIYFLKRYNAGKSYYYDFSISGMKEMAKSNVESNSDWYPGLISQYLKCIERFKSFIDRDVFDLTASELNFRLENYKDIGMTVERTQKALEYYPSIAFDLNERARIGAENLKDYSLMAFTLVQKGQILRNLGKFEDAKQSFIESLIPAQSIADPNDKTRALFEISKEFRNIRMFEHANRILVESLDLAQMLENPFVKTGALTSIGNAFREINDFKNASRAFNESLKSIQGIENPIFRANAFSSISKYFKEIGDPERAIEALNMSLASAREIEDQSFKLDAMEMLRDKYKMFDVKDRFAECAKEAKEIAIGMDLDPMRGCTVHGHSLGLKEFGMQFDMLARTEMGADGNIYRIKDQVGIPLDKKVNLGKPMSEAEAKKRTTIFRFDGVPMSGTVGSRKYDDAVEALHHMLEFRNKWAYTKR